jgi:predicted AlkP superfamily phosphohydrolase/phosphomutase
MAERVLLVGIEAMEISLVRQGVAEGWLPAIASLLEEGTAVRLAHGPDLLPGAGWTTVFTGRPVQDHLLIFNRQLAPGTTRIEEVSGDAARVPVFWQVASEAGVRSTVVSAHGAPRLPGFNGTQVLWGTGDPYTSQTEPWSDRPEVLDSLRRGWPGRRFGFLDRLPRSASDYQAYLDDVCRQIRMQGEGLAHLMQATEWDFFFGTFYETHEAGHLLWHLQDGAGTDGLHQPMRRVYQEIDAALGRLLARRDEDTRTFLLTSSGMTRNVPTCQATRSFLRQGGWMAFGDQAPAGDDKWLWWASRARTAVHRVTPLALRKALSRLAPAAHGRLVSAGPLLGVDWSATSAFPLPNDTTSAIRFNVAGREPDGIVEPGSGYDRLAAEMDAAVADLVDARTGAPVARQVYRLDRLVGGPVGDVLPDLVIEWEPVVVEALDSPRTGPITVPGDPRTGDHRPEGFLIGAGPGVAAGGGGLDDDDAFGLLDVAPTILAAMGVAIPPALPGRPITAVLPA